MTTGAEHGAGPAYGSDLIVDVLRTLGIEYAALNPGATFRGIHDSLVNYGSGPAAGRPALIQCCHEEIAVAIAHGYAKAAGRPMAAIVHDLVGLQHASMAIYNAWCDRVPMLVLGGTGPMAVERRRPWIDWIHTALVQGQAVRDYVKWDDQPASLASIPEALIRGYRIATTEPQGPVYICFDADLQEGTVDEPITIPDVARYAAPSPIQAAPAALAEAAALLMRAERPVIVAEYVGRNRTAAAALVRLAERAAAPVIDVYGYGRFNVPTTHPLDLTGAEAEILGEADLILALDVLDLQRALATVDRTTRRARPLIADAARVVHISLNEPAARSWAQTYGRLHPVDLPILADTAVALPALAALLDAEPAGGAARRARADRLRARHDALRRGARTRCEERWEDRPISPGRLAAEIWDVVRADAWVLANGSLDGWARELWDWTRPEQYLGGSGGAGLGYGAGASIGAALAYRGTGTICLDLQADGDLLYTPSALWTAAHHRLPVLFVICNNRTYLNDEHHQALMARARGRPPERRTIGIGIDDPAVDFAAMARAFGVQSEGPIEDPSLLGPAVRRAVRAVRDEARPALLDVVIAAE